jgi:hypothetical protein
MTSFVHKLFCCSGDFGDQINLSTTSCRLQAHFSSELPIDPWIQANLLRGQLRLQSRWMQQEPPILHPIVAGGKQKQDSTEEMPSLSSWVRPA